MKATRLGSLENRTESLLHLPKTRLGFESFPAEGMQPSVPLKKPVLPSSLALRPSERPLDLDRNTQVDVTESAMDPNVPGPESKPGAGDDTDCSSSFGGTVVSGDSDNEWEETEQLDGLDLGLGKDENEQ